MLREPAAHQAVDRFRLFSIDGVSDALERVPFVGHAVPVEDVLERCRLRRADGVVGVAVEDDEGCLDPGRLVNRRCRKAGTRGHAAAGDRGRHKAARFLCSQSDRHEAAHAVPVGAETVRVDLGQAGQNVEALRCPPEVFLARAETPPLGAVGVQSSARRRSVGVVAGNAHKSPLHEFPRLPDAERLRASPEPVADENARERPFAFGLEQNALHRQAAILVGPPIAVPLEAGKRFTPRRRASERLSAERERVLVRGVEVGLTARPLEDVGGIDAQVVTANAEGGLHHRLERAGGRLAGRVEHLEVEPGLLAPGQERRGARAVPGIVVAAESVLAHEAALRDAVVADRLHLAGSVEAPRVQGDQQLRLPERRRRVVDRALHRLQPEFVRILASRRWRVYLRTAA